MFHYNPHNTIARIFLSCSNTLKAMTDYTWSWVGECIQVEQKDPYTHYAAAKRSGNDGSIRVFNVGDAVLTFDDDGTSMFAHVVDMYYTPPDDNQSHPSLEQNSSNSAESHPMLMRVILRWFYDVDDVPNLRVPEDHLLFSDHIEPDGTNLLHVISGKAWLFPSVRQAKAFIRDPSPEYDSSTDEVRTVSRYLNASDPALKSTRALRPGELENLLANPSRGSFFTNPFLPQPTSSSESEENRPKAKNKKSSKTNRRPRSEVANASSEDAQTEESSHSSSSFQQPSSDSASEEDDDMNIDESVLLNQDETLRPRRTRSSYMRQKSPFKPEVSPSPSSPISQAVASPQSCPPASPADQPALHRLRRRDEFDSKEENPTDLVESLPTSWHEPILSKPKNKPRTRAKTSRSRRSSKKRSSSPRESSPLSATAPIEFSFVAATPPPLQTFVRKNESLAHTTGGHITTSCDGIFVASEPPTKRHRSTHTPPCSQPDIAKAVLASTFQSISKPLAPITSHVIVGPTIGSSIRGPPEIPTSPPPRAPTSVPSALSVSESQEKAPRKFSVLPTQGENSPELRKPFEPRRTATGAVFQPTAPRDGANTMPCSTTLIAPLSSGILPGASDIRASVQCAGSSFNPFENIQTNVLYTAPVRATAVPVVNLHKFPHGADGSGKANSTTGSMSIRGARRIRTSVVSRVKTEPQLNHAGAVPSSSIPVVNHEVSKRRIEKVVENRAMGLNGPRVHESAVPNNLSRTGDDTNLSTPTIPTKTVQVNGTVGGTFKGREPHKNISKVAVERSKTRVKREDIMAEDNYMAVVAKEEPEFVLRPATNVLGKKEIRRTGEVDVAARRAAKGTRFVKTQPEVGASLVLGYSYSTEAPKVSGKEVIADPDSVVYLETDADDGTNMSFEPTSANADARKSVNIADHDCGGATSATVNNANSEGQDEVLCGNSKQSVRAEGNTELTKLVHELNVLYTGFTRDKRDKLNLLLGPFAQHVGAVLAKYENGSNEQSLSDDMAEQIVRQTLLELEAAGMPIC